MKRGQKTSQRKPEQRSHVYVIELDRAVLKHKKFVTANPDYDQEKACLYVGMTGKSPDERLAQHKAGYKASRFPRKYGRWLRRRLYERFNPMTYEEACAKEIELAEDLRQRGFAVWQH
jgi:hypothetical protein